MVVEIVVVVYGEEKEVVAKGRYSPDIRPNTWGDYDPFRLKEPPFVKLDDISFPDGRTVEFADFDETIAAMEVAKQALIIQGEEEDGFEQEGKNHE